MQSLSIIGFGTFGQFMSKHLRAHFELFAWNRSDQSQAARELGVRYVGVEEALQKDIIVFGLNVQAFEPFLKAYGAKVAPHSLFVDVASVKKVPEVLMLRYLPDEVEIIGSHPLFGPQSGAQGIRDLDMILCPVRSSRLECVHQFLQHTLGLRVAVMSSDKHDESMAFSQALTHFVGRAVNQMAIPALDHKTKSYEALLLIKDQLGKDSLDLFRVIENYNPYAAAVRERFVQELSNLEKQLSDTPT